MFSKEIVVRCESGLHNRQATYFVQKANEFQVMCRETIKLSTHPPIVCNIKFKSLNPLIYQ